MPVRWLFEKIKVKKFPCYQLWSSRISATGINILGFVHSTKGLSELILYKLTRKFDTVQSENKKTPESTVIQALFLIKRCVYLKNLIIVLSKQRQHVDQ